MDAMRRRGPSVGLALGMILLAACASGAPTGAPTGMPTDAPTDAAPSATSVAAPLAGATSGPAAGADGAAAKASPVIWIMDWDLSGVTVSADGGEAVEAAWTVENDLGYAYRLRRGWVTAFRAELVACPHEDPAHVATPTGAAAWWRLLQVRVALAGHGTTIDPSRTRVALLEDLAHPRSQEQDRVSTSDDPYCMAHLNIAPAPEDAALAAGAADMAGQSLTLEGAWRGPGAGAWQDFQLRTAEADGVNVDLTRPDGSQGRMDPDGRRWTVTVTRRLSALFSGVAWDRPEADGVERALLRNLMNSATAAVAVDGAGNG